MSGLIEALEIFSNPGDLIVGLGEKNDSGSTPFFISRGDGHNGKLIISGHIDSEDREACIVVIERILTIIIERVSSHFKDKESLLVQILGDYDESKVLTKELIETICSRLKDEKEVWTESL